MYHNREGVDTKKIFRWLAVRNICMPCHTIYCETVYTRVHTYIFVLGGVERPMANVFIFFFFFGCFVSFSQERNSSFRHTHKTKREMFRSFYLQNGKYAEWVPNFWVKSFTIMPVGGFWLHRICSTMTTTKKLPSKKKTDLLIFRASRWSLFPFRWLMRHLNRLSKEIFALSFFFWPRNICNSFLCLKN